MAIITHNLSAAEEELLRGNLIGLPTETVYGLAGNALSEDAILKIYKTKNRPAFDPLIVHTHGVKEIYKYVKEVPKELEILLSNFSPGPITFLLPKNKLISDLITSGLERVAFRIPAHPIALELLRKLPFPLAAPSANPFGYVSPTTPQHVEDQLGEKLNFILDGGNCDVGVESTIIGTEGNELIIYRLGGISVESIEAVVGKKATVKSQSSSNPKAPGMLLSHYAPKKVLLPVSELDKGKSSYSNVGYIGFKQFHKLIPKANQLLLSANDSTEEAARNLFKTLRLTEQLPPATFYVESLPETGLGRAVNDRLRRAMYRR